MNILDYDFKKHQQMIQKQLENKEMTSFGQISHESIFLKIIFF